MEIRRKILQAAVDIMTKKSFESASMREIAQSAGIGEATIYNYFMYSQRKALHTSHMSLAVDEMAVNFAKAMSTCVAFTPTRWAAWAPSWCAPYNDRSFSI